MTQQSSLPPEAYPLGAHATLKFNIASSNTVRIEIYEYLYLYDLLDTYNMLKNADILTATDIIENYGMTNMQQQMKQALRLI